MLWGGRILRSCERRLRAHREVPTWYEPGHVLLASYPKSGNTWLRFIMSNLSREIGNHAEPVDFHSVARYVPEIRRNRGLERRIETAGFPLFLKTHSPYIAGFSPYRSVVIVRDPADTLVSYHRHLSEAAGKRLPPLSSFVHHWRYGCTAWREWYAEWLERADYVIRYEDLLDDPVGEVDKALRALDLEPSRDLIEIAVRRSSKERMRSAQMERGDPNLKNRAYQFVGKARSGWSRERLDSVELERLYRCAGEVAESLGYSASAAAGRAGACP